MQFARIASSVFVTVGFAWFYLVWWADTVAIYSGYPLAIFAVPAIVGACIGAAIYALPVPGLSRTPSAPLSMLISSLAGLILPVWIMLMMMRPE